MSFSRLVEHVLQGGVRDQAAIPIVLTIDFDGSEGRWQCAARHDVADYLEVHGWDTVGVSIKNLSAVSGLTPVAGDGLEDAVGWIVFVSASRR